MTTAEQGVCVIPGCRTRAVSDGTCTVHEGHRLVPVELVRSGSEVLARVAPQPEPGWVVVWATLADSGIVWGQWQHRAELGFTFEMEPWSTGATCQWAARFEPLPGAGHLDAYPDDGTEAARLRLAYHLATRHGYSEDVVANTAELGDLHAREHPEEAREWSLVSPSGQRYPVPALGEFLSAVQAWRAACAATEGEWVDDEHRYASGLTDADRHRAADLVDRQRRAAFRELDTVVDRLATEPEVDDDLPEEDDVPQRDEHGRSNTSSGGAL